MALGSITDRSVNLVVGNDLDTVVLPNSDTGVGGAEIYGGSRSRQSSRVDVELCRVDDNYGGSREIRDSWWPGGRGRREEEREKREERRSEIHGDWGVGRIILLE
ncbi:hypothetical protein Vadar_016897 [Vaccinium darrowii]|uniref:Uncharacterized protein n=1 Tax=Vaccinium darrowii TaxID=229202 RepID=A0ACB7Y0B9_9ERIC|nr:hypothetical protein Vadar_016897 [Vaccinium darrowii]